MTLYAFVLTEKYEKKSSLSRARNVQVQNNQ